MLYTLGSADENGNELALCQICVIKFIYNEYMQRSVFSHGFSKFRPELKRKSTRLSLWKKSVIFSVFVIISVNLV